MNISATHHTQATLLNTTQPVAQQKPIAEAKKESAMLQDIASISTSERVGFAVKEGLVLGAKVGAGVGAAGGGLVTLLVGGATSAMSGKPMSLENVAVGLGVGALVGGVIGASGGAASGVAVGFSDNKRSAQVFSALVGAGASALVSLAQGKGKGEMAFNAVMSAASSAYIGGTVFDRTAAKIAEQK